MASLFVAYVRRGSGIRSNKITIASCDVIGAGILVKPEVAALYMTKKKPPTKMSIAVNMYTSVFAYCTLIITKCLDLVIGPRGAYFSRYRM